MQNAADLWYFDIDIPNEHTLHCWRHSTGATSQLTTLPLESDVLQRKPGSSEDRICIDWHWWIENRRNCSHYLVKDSPNDLQNTSTAGRWISDWPHIHVETFGTSCGSNAKEIRPNLQKVDGPKCAGNPNYPPNKTESIKSRSKSWSRLPFPHVSSSICHKYTSQIKASGAVSRIPTIALKCITISKLWTYFVLPLTWPPDS